jgi:hypothetical protein
MLLLSPAGLRAPDNAVDQGYEVDPVAWDTPNQPHNPNQPHKVRLFVAGVAGELGDAF